MTNILLIMFTAILTENFIFSRFYGCCPFLGVSDKPSTALGMGMAVTFVMTVSSAATWAVYHLVLVPAKMEVLKTIAFILVIATLVQFIEMFLRKFIPVLYSSLGIYLPLITTNCAVLGSALVVNRIREGCPCSPTPWPEGEAWGGTEDQPRQMGLSCFQQSAQVALEALPRTSAGVPLLTIVRSISTTLSA